MLLLNIIIAILVAGGLYAIRVFCERKMAQNTIDSVAHDMRFLGRDHEQYEDLQFALENIDDAICSKAQRATIIELLGTLTKEKRDLWIRTNALNN